MSVATTSRIFIGKISHVVTEEQIKEQVIKYGVVTTLYYMQDHSQQGKGWSFVTYTTRQEALNAINAIDGKLQFPDTERAVEARFANHKPKALCATLNAANTKPATPWQQYFSPEGHPYYYNFMTGVTQWERPAEMDVIGPPECVQPRETTSTFGPPGANLFVFHIPSDWNDIDVVQHFQHFGNIVSARIQRDSTGRNRGFGFVSFDNILSATNAIRGMDSFCVNGKFLKVQRKKGEDHFCPPETVLGRVTGPTSNNKCGATLRPSPY